jgi:hypothetical protein
MLNHDLLRDLGFADARGPSSDHQQQQETTAGSQKDFNHDMGLYLFGFLLVIIIVVGCLRICITSGGAGGALGYEREDAPAAAESPRKAIHKTPKWTLGERKQAILGIFETSQVTMVSNCEHGKARRH